MDEDYGAIISEQGIPYKQASDDQKVLDTRWLTLDIVAEPVYTNTLTLATSAPGDGSTLGFTKGTIILYSHNLGFLPAFDYEIGSISISDPNAQNVAEDVEVVSDGNNIYYFPNIGTIDTSITVTVTINLRIYNLPITNSYTAPVVQSTPVSAPTPSEYGVEFLNSNSTALDIQDASINDFSFSTALRPLTVLQTGTYTVTTSGPNDGFVVITYDYGEHPLYLLATYSPPGTFTSLTGLATLVGPVVGSLSFAGSRGTISNNTITIGGQQAALDGSFAYILFKDPLDLGL